jgi:predicted  nucleic acid-binding Zn-ribbon protein
MKIAETEKELAKAEVFELKEQLQKLQKDRDHLEAKAKSELKVLAREIKTLRKSQPELKEELEMVIKDKAKLQVLLHFHLEMEHTFIYLW